MSDGEIIEKIYSINREELKKKYVKYEPMHTTDDWIVEFDIPIEAKWDEKE